jgi:peroxiredoxin Q/BCP
MPTSGSPVPDFELPNQDGKHIKLSDYRGQKVILFAFPQAFTAGCEAQACGFRDEFPRIQTANAVIFGLSPDSPETLKKWKTVRKLPYDLLSDPDHTVLNAWSAWGRSLFGLITIPRTTRSFWAIDENGAIIDSQIGITPAASIERALAAVEKR